jgi:23S rRNA (adenine-N6)-dimethyltransferase
VLVVAGDAFDQPLPALPFRVVSNPPFDSTTRLLRLLLQDPASRLERAVLVVQWEVALKRSRCRPSTQLGLSWAPWWRIRLDRRLPAAAFRPPPSTNAGVLVVAPRSEPLLEPSEASRFRALVRSAFRSGVQELVSPVELRRLGLPRRPAPRDLGAEEFVALYRFLHGRGRA